MRGMYKSPASPCPGVPLRQAAEPRLRCCPAGARKVNGAGSRWGGECQNGPPRVVNAVGRGANVVAVAVQLSPRRANPAMLRVVAARPPVVSVPVGGAEVWRKRAHTNRHASIRSEEEVVAVLAF